MSINYYKEIITIALTAILLASSLQAQERTNNVREFKVYDTDDGLSANIVYKMARTLKDSFG